MPNDCTKSPNPNYHTVQKPKSRLQRFKQKYQLIQYSVLCCFISLNYMNKYVGLEDLWE